MDNMTDGEAEAKAAYIAAGMTENEYETFEFFVSLRYALEDTGMDELATPLRTIILLIDRWTERERQRACVSSDVAGSEPDDASD